MQITPDDGLPPFICFNCSEQLEKAFQLKLQCEESDKVLRRHLNGSTLNFDSDVFSDTSSDVCTHNSKQANHEIKVDIASSTSTKDDFASDSDSKLDTKQTSHACAICGAKHEDNAKLVNHMQQTHPEVVQKKEKDFKETLVCTICNKVYLKANNLAAHMATHTGNKSIECKVCGKRFTQGRAFACHLRTHSDSGAKQHQCEVCKKEFAKANQLQVGYNVCCPF